MRAGIYPVDELVVDDVDVPVEEAARSLLRLVDDDWVVWWVAVTFTEEACRRLDRHPVERMPRGLVEITARLRDGSLVHGKAHALVSTTPTALEVTVTFDGDGVLEVA